uniref:Uncharacterized protein n=1 Tax=Steinernema glaseri TaxID=37863 RepID=A0A1I7YVR6_9BILA
MGDLEMCCFADERDLPDEYCEFTPTASSECVKCIPLLLFDGHSTRSTAVRRRGTGFAIAYLEHIRCGELGTTTSDQIRSISIERLIPQEDDKEETLTSV